MSFGGSSMLVLMTGIGLVLNVSRQADADFNVSIGPENRVKKKARVLISAGGTGGHLTGVGRRKNIARAGAPGPFCGQER